MFQESSVSPEGSADYPVLARASEKATLESPYTAVDLAEWIMTLRDEEYQSYAPGEHKASGLSVDEFGRPVSICVEMVGSQLMVQHYVPEVMTPNYCRLVSLSDVFAAGRWTNVLVTWEVRVASSNDTDGCVFTNSILSQATPDFETALRKSGLSLADAARQRAGDVSAHNRRETPAFALGIERRSRGRSMSTTRS